jgi:hypothetical protein
MDMKRDYYEDIRLLDSGAQVFWLIALLAALTVFPFFASSYLIYTVNLMAINVIVALGLNLLVGYTGQISLGHAGFFAIGSYITLVLMSKLGVPFAAALIAGGLVSAAFGFILGLPALRLEGPYLAIATLGFGLTITQILGRIDYFGGHMGLQAPPLDVFGLGHRHGRGALRGDNRSPVFGYGLGFAQSGQDPGGPRIRGHPRQRHRRPVHRGEPDLLQDLGLCRERLLHRHRRRAHGVCAGLHQSPHLQHHDLHLVPGHGGGGRPGLHPGLHHGRGADHLAADRAGAA